MTHVRVAFPATILLLSLSIPATGQTFESTRSMVMAPGVAQVPSPQDPVIVVRPEISDEQMGDLYMVRKQYREAAEQFKRLSDKNPRNPVYLNKLGIALHQQEALGSALKYYERAVKVDPRYADAENNVGTIWYQRKKFRKAIKAYEKAIKMRNDMAVLYSNLGYAYFGERKYEEAILAFRHALTLDPLLFEHNGSRNGSVLQDRSVEDHGKFDYLLAKSFAQAGDLARCIHYLRKSKDEGYKNLADITKDPAFAAALKSPEVQELLIPRPAEPSQL
ncbi:MAG TPA: tetratricopeptide repeat protein [Candidatus Acidoferrum sp.]|nr:tetratricopeptide repeat protein [Candidatus Acidoferrum sp.]